MIPEGINNKQYLPRSSFFILYYIFFKKTFKLVRKIIKGCRGFNRTWDLTPYSNPIIFNGLSSNVYSSGWKTVGIDYSTSSVVLMVNTPVVLIKC